MSAVSALRSNVTAPGQAKAFGGSRRDPLAVVTNNAGQLPKKAKKEATAVPQPAQVEAPVPAPMEIVEDQAPVAMLPVGVEDIDEQDAYNTQMATEYVTEIYNYMRQLEQRLAVPESYLDRQPDVNGRMRAILVDWLVEVHHRFDLMQETLYLTVHLVDRYLSLKRINRSHLQLVGVTAMLIASKYEDMYPPEVADFVYISDNAFTARNILDMERSMLKALNFALGRPLPLHFLRRNSRAGHADITMHTIAKYLMELTLCSSTMLKYLPSEIAAAACYISREVVNEQEPWNATIEHYADYTLADVQPCIEDLRAVLAGSGASKQQATRKKFSDPKFLRIAKLPDLEAYIANML